MVMIAPSILSADYADLKNEIIRLDEAGADMIHLDVMDGNFVPNLTFGPGVVKAIRPYTKLPFDVHLMVSNPAVMIPWFANAGADIITIHSEACTHLDRALATIRSLGLKAGVSLNPSTPEEVLKYVLDKLDLVLIMSVNPGFGGQSFIPGTIAKLHELKAMCERHGVSPMIEVDGGISSKNIAEVVKAGADVLVAGSAVFKSEDPAAEVALLQKLGNEAAQEA